MSIFLNGKNLHRLIRLQTWHKISLVIGYEPLLYALYICKMT